MAFVKNVPLLTYWLIVSKITVKHGVIMDEIFFLMNSSEKLYTSQGMHMAERIFVLKGTTQKRTGCCLH